MSSFHQAFLKRTHAHQLMILRLLTNQQNIRYLTYLNSSTFVPHTTIGSSSTIQEWAKMISTQVSNCTNIQQLNQIYAQIIRTHMLEFFNAPFYWNTVIRSYARLEFPSKSLTLFLEMLRGGVHPDHYTLPIVLKSVSMNFGCKMVSQFHSVALKHGLEKDVFCESGFISLYSKGGEFESAYKVFDENCERKLGSWNAMIGGLAQGGRSKEAIDMFVELKRSGFQPDDVTMVSVTSACGSVGDLSLGLQLHKCVFQAKSLGRSDILMLNSLIDMYGKCGRMDMAYKVFSSMVERNVSSWTSLIVGYAMHGHVSDALINFHYMREAGVRPNNVTFVGVLSACVHGGKVQEGKHYYTMMKNEYRIMPKLQHYGCMVDLLSRAGLFEEARDMVEKMPMKPNVVIWGCLMGACEKYGNVEMGEWVAKHLQELEPWNDGVYVVMSNIYASNGLWDGVQRMRRIMKERKLAKVPGYSMETRLN